MRLRLQTARHQHAVKNFTEYAAAQAASLARIAESTGDPTIVPLPPTRALLAYVSAGNWVGDCDCGAGIAIEPDWPEALCFACGRSYEVTLPDTTEREAIEDLLSRRQRRNQHWRPQDGETSATLAAENAEHGVE